MLLLSGNSELKSINGGESNAGDSWNGVDRRRPVTSVAHIFRF
jgi:hypothetical protein